MQANRYISFSLTRQVGEGEDRYRFRVTSAAPNRLGDTTDISGIETPPSVPLLYNHSEADVLGRWFDFTRDADALYATARFDEGDPDAVALKGKVDRQIIESVSIGFKAIKQTPRFPHSREYKTHGFYTGPVHLERAILTEISLVAVPADITATRVRSLNADAEQQIADIVRDVFARRLGG